MSTETDIHVNPLPTTYAERVREAMDRLHSPDGEARIVSFVDDLLTLALELGSLACTAPTDQTWRFQSHGQEICTVEVHRARGLLRTICARLATVCHERTGQEFSPYGTQAEFDYGWWDGRQARLSVCFVNTQARHEFTIEARPVA